MVVNVEATSTGRLYKYIQTEFKYEPYLDNLNRPLNCFNKNLIKFTSFFHRKG